VTRCDDMVTSTEGEAALERGKGGDDCSWADVNITRLKFSCFKWTVKI
jgi:hypothetical protein